MATLNPVIRPYQDCTAIKFTDKTGRQPASPDGYGASEDLSLYTGLLEFFDYDDNLAGSYIVTPADNNQVETIYLGEDADNTITDGVYRMRYSVIDGTNTTVYFVDTFALFMCSTQCKIAELSLSSLTCCRVCKKIAEKNLSRAYGLYYNIQTLLNGGNLPLAHKAFCVLQSVVNTKCKC